MGRQLCQRLRKAIPRAMFEIIIQAVAGTKPVARERIAPYRKQVTAKLYGGDVTRKNKLLDKQKEGKKRMKSLGGVQVPQEAFIEVLGSGDSGKAGRRK